MSLNYGLKPFWFWNGDMQEEEIARQIREMKDKCIGGFFIHPRNGLTIPYLSLQWFEKVSFAVEEAKKNNLEVWFYDEYPYPSGIAGGQVLLDNSDYEAKVLKPTRFDEIGPKHIEIELPWGNVIFARAYKIENDKIDWNSGIDISANIGICRREKIFQMTGLTAYNRKRFFEGENYKRLVYNIPKGKWRIYVFVETTLEHMKFFGKFVDPLNKDAIKAFIKNTHEQYKKHLGYEFGKTIKGIFSDEIDLQPHDGEMRWSNKLPVLFFERNAYDLIDKLPALMEPMGKDTQRIRYDYWNTMINAFIESYDIPIQDWCHENGLLYAAEKPILRSSQLQYIDIPGIDAGHAKVYGKSEIASENYRANAKLLSSAAQLYDKKRALCESYHSIGWGMTLQDAKWIIDWLSVQGINMFVPHAYFYTTNSLTKHDAPPSQFFQQPYWKHTGVLSNYAASLSKPLAEGKRKVDILVVDPVTSTWTAMGEKSWIMKRIRQDFSTLQNILLQNHLDYYVIDPELLGQASVQCGEINIHKDKYKVLILPPMLNLEDKALEVVKSFAKSNGVLISACCLPAEDIGRVKDVASIFLDIFSAPSEQIYHNYINGEKSEDYRGTENSNIYFIGDLNRLPNILANSGIRDISVAVKENEVEDIIAAHISINVGEWYLMVNVNGKHYNTDIALKNYKYKNPAVIILPMGSGEKEREIPCTMKNSIISFKLSFEAFQSYGIIIRESFRNDRTIEQSLINKVELDIDSEWKMKINHLNALRFYEWNFRLQESGEKICTGTTPKIVNCKPVIDQLADSGIPLPVKLREYFGCPKELKFPSFQCMYSTEFDADIKPEKTLLVMEPGSISGEWEIWLNSSKINPEDFVQSYVYDLSNMVCDVTELIKPGVNTLDIYVKVDKTFNGVINPIYLFGDFGVFKSSHQRKWGLSKLPTVNRVKDLQKNGLPFYAGDIILGKNITIAEVPDTGLEFYISDPVFQDAVELYINGNNIGARAWKPYMWHVDKKWLVAGENEVELHISTTLQGLFEGQTFDNEKHIYTDL